MESTTCPNCGAPGMSVFWEVKDVPVHSVLLMPTREVALSYPKGDIRLAFCRTCGFISNAAFDPRVHEYSTRYEETQGFSPTFNAFHHRLAASLVERYGLRGKDIIEIGCGKGEFLSLLCKLGGNRGVGFDPAFVAERSPDRNGTQITFIQDFYSEKYTHYRGDFVCCKMTLEHIPDTARFLGTVRRAVGEDPKTVVFFQVPDATRVLRDTAFWDVYYEHCSYFTSGSLARLFRNSGFEVIDVATDYDDQYLMIAARPRQGQSSSSADKEIDPETTGRDIGHFVENAGAAITRWKKELAGLRQDGRRAVIWGSGSKGVAFLTALGITDEIGYAVDINPYRQGCFMPGTGHRIVGPEFLREYKPDVAIAMNPVYREEIQRDLDRMQLNTRLLTV